MIINIFEHLYREVLRLRNDEPVPTDHDIDDVTELVVEFLFRFLTILEFAKKTESIEPLPSPRIWKVWQIASSLGAERFFPMACSMFDFSDAQRRSENLERYEMTLKLYSTLFPGVSLSQDIWPSFEAFAPPSPTAAVIEEDDEMEEVHSHDDSEDTIVLANEAKERRKSKAMNKILANRGGLGDPFYQFNLVEFISTPQPTNHYIKLPLKGIRSVQDACEAIAVKLKLGDVKGSMMYFEQWLMHPEQALQSWMKSGTRDTRFFFYLNDDVLIDGSVIYVTGLGCGIVVKSIQSATFGDVKRAVFELGLSELSVCEKLSEFELICERGSTEFDDTLLLERRVLPSAALGYRIIRHLIVVLHCGNEIALTYPENAEPSISDVKAKLTIDYPDYELFDNSSRLRPDRASALEGNSEEKSIFLSKHTFTLHPRLPSPLSKTRICDAFTDTQILGFHVDKLYFPATSTLLFEEVVPGDAQIVLNFPHILEIPVRTVVGIVYVPSHTQQSVGDLKRVISEYTGQGKLKDEWKDVELVGEIWKGEEVEMA